MVAGLQSWDHRAVLGWLPWLECCHGGIQALWERQAKKTRSRRVALCVAEQLECIELSLGTDDACKSLEGP